MTTPATGRQKGLAVATVTVICGVVILTQVVDPQLRGRKARLAELRESHLQLVKMKADLLVKNRIDEAYRRVEPLVAGHGTDQQEISAFSREVSDVYAKLNLRTKSVKILPVRQEESYRLLSIRIEVEGRVREVIQFILAVEAHPKPLRIEQFTLRSQEIADTVRGSFLVTKVAAGRRV